MEGLEVDIEQLIGLVRDRPVLWDRTLEEYKSRNLTVVVWREVCQQLHHGFNAMQEPERNDFCKLVMKKWTNVKDSWMRSHRKSLEQQRFGVRLKTRKYIYDDQLSFLKKNTLVGESDYSFMLENETLAGADSPPGSGSQHSDDEQQPKGKRPRMVEIEAVPTLGDPADDRHLSFFRSVLPSLRGLSEEETLQLQIGVLGLVQGLRRTRGQPPPCARFCCLHYAPPASACLHTHKCCKPEPPDTSAL